MLIHWKPGVLVFGVAIAGCSGVIDDMPREAISGAVTLKGQPLDVGSISFRPSGGPGQGPGMSAESRIERGRYSISREQGLVPGKYKVIISAAQGSAGNNSAAPPGSGIKRPDERVPPRYNVASTLTAEVAKDGRNVFDFDLK